MNSGFKGFIESRYPSKFIIDCLNIRNYKKPNDIYFLKKYESEDW